MDAAGYIECGDNRDVIVFPWLREVIAARAPEAVLDYGCGDARFAVELAGSLAGRLRVFAHERDAAMAAAARERVAASGAENASGGVVTLLDAPRDAAEWAGRFDVIFLQGVWMCWATQEECVGNLRLLAEALRPGGVVLASVTHPCFRDRRFATYRTDFSMARYLDEGTPFTVHVGRPGAETPIVDTHWSLAGMINQVIAAGLGVREVKEHADGAAGALPSWLTLVLGRAGDQA